MCTSIGVSFSEITDRLAVINYRPHIFYFEWGEGYINGMALEYTLEVPLLQIGDFLCQIEFMSSLRFKYFQK